MTFHLIRLKNMPITEQLKLEDRLLRHTTENWCLINEGSSPTVVMGISGKAEELVDLAKAEEANIPVIKRFSGGGTVIVDEETLFVTFICQKELHPFPAYPEHILKWSESIYKGALPSLALRENDFVIGEKKCGGNAQYIKKDRWLHHTSFLWNYSPERMNILLYPKKTPSYRQGRSHDEFLCRLSDHLPDRETWIEGLKRALLQAGHRVEVASHQLIEEHPEAQTLISH
jgi:lipoate-protein ligase A